jgi:acyl-coenzyme A thioesterase PaaI-like protein
VSRADDFEVAASPPAGEPDGWRAWANELTVSRHLGLRCTELGEGRVSFRIEEPPLRNSRGWVHGALLLGAFDQCAGITLMWSLGGKLRASTANLSARFLRPALAPVTLEGFLVKQGRTVNFVEVHAAGADGRPCARADVTFTLRPHGE